MKEPKHTAEWQSLLNAAADKFVTNHKDGEVRRMYGHHFRSFVDGAVWEFERNADNFDKMKEALIEVNEALDGISDILSNHYGDDPEETPNIDKAIDASVTLKILLESIK